MLHNLKLKLLVAAPSRGNCVPVWAMYGCGRDYVILIPFRLPQISYFTLKVKCFYSDSDNCPDVDRTTCFSSPTGQGQIQSYQHSCFRPEFLCPTEFFVVLYILFCMHFCISRCIPDISVERDVLHVHLPLCHLVLSKSLLIKVKKESENLG